MSASLNRRSFVAGAAATSALGLAAAVASNVQAHQALADEQAADPDAVEWPGSPLDASTLDIAETYDCEVLVCGLGAGGSIATCRLAQLGVDTIAIEKSSVHGSVKTFICAVDAAPQVEAGCTFDTDRIAKELVRYASGYANQRLIKTYLSESADMVSWLDETFADDGVKCYAETDVADGKHDIFDLWPVQVSFSITYTAEVQAKIDAVDSPNPDAKMAAAPGIADFALEHAEADGARIMYDTPLVQLVQDESGRVTGAIAQREDESYVQINASKGVILATGGYEADPDLLAKLNPAGAKLGGVAMTQPGCKGDGIRAGIWAGGAKDANPTLMTFSRSALPVDAEPGYPYQGVTCWIGDQPFLKVNTKGERFCNETAPYDWPLHAATMEPGHKVCSIWDANYQEHIKAFHTLGCSRIDPSPDQPDHEGIGFEALEGQIEAAAEAGCVVTADTIEELADKLGMDPQVLSATVTRYNELCEAGVDEDFGKPAQDLIALTTPPYSAAYFAGHVLCTIDGLQIDPDGRVIDAEKQQPIEGLWAVGNCSGSFYSVTYPELLWGNANGRTLTMALHAAKLLAE